MNRDLKYRSHLSSSIDKGIYEAFHHYALKTRIPMSRLLDEAIGDFLTKHQIKYLSFAPYNGELRYPSES